MICCAALEQVGYFCHELFEVQPRKKEAEASLVSISE
jgi:hypothetical protein